MFEHSNFKEAIFFDGAELGTGTATSKVIANPKQASLRVVGWFNDGASGTGTGSKTVAVKVQGAAKSDATGTDWKDIETGTFSSTGTAFSGESFNKVVDADYNYVRALLSGSGVSGELNLAAEYIAR
jgi:hypothetical protein